MLPLVAALLLTGAAAEGAAGAVARGAEELAARLAPGEAPAVGALAVLAPSEPLRSAVLTALGGALGRSGWSVVPLQRRQLGDPEAAARAAGCDLLLTVRAALAGRSLTLVAEVLPTRGNFFLQGRPAARPAGSRLVAVEVEADAAARALAAAGAGRAVLALRPLADLPERVLALAAGPTAEGATPRVVAVTPSAVLLLDASGAVLSSHPLSPPPPGPRLRDPWATAVVSTLGPGRIGYALAGRGGGEILSAAGDRLRVAAPLPAVPVAAGAAGVLVGSFAPGLGALEDSLSLSLAGERPPPRSARPLLGAAAAPGPGRIAFAVLDADFTLRLLGPTLAQVAPEVPGVGAAFALADLDGDGDPEVVASSALPGSSDRVRVLRPGGAGREPLFQSGPVPGSLRAAAAADLTGDGLDDVVLAAALGEGGTRLWLLTADDGGGR